MIYRVARDGKATILFEETAAAQAEVRTLLAAADGTLYAGTAAEAGGSGGARNSLFLTRAGAPHSVESDGPDRASSGEDDEGAGVVRAAQAPQSRPGSPATPKAAPGGSAAPRPVTPGDNAVYRIDTDGIPREVLRVKALIHALAWADDRLWVGTGPEGQLYEVRERGEETAPIAKLDNGQVLALLAEPGGGLLIGTGDPGGVLRLSAEFATVGRLVSEVHDTRLISRFGTMSWRAIQPPGTSVTVQARTGNVGDPDETWSDWSPEQADPGSARVASPPGRFVQYRVKLATSDPRRTPELRSIALSYRTANLAPEITRLDVPDLSAADGAVHQTRLNLRWEASDPNDDDLRFTVSVRKEGWPNWIRLTDEPISEKNHAWDTTAFPSGLYHVKVVASDRTSNRPDDALTRERESLSFLVDHDPPHVRLEAKGRGAGITLTDELHADRQGGIRSSTAAYGRRCSPMTRSSTSLREQITLSLPDLASGVHILMVKATDAAGEHRHGRRCCSMGKGRVRSDSGGHFQGADPRQGEARSDASPALPTTTKGARQGGCRGLAGLDRRDRAPG